MTADVYVACVVFGGMLLLIALFTAWQLHESRVRRYHRARAAIARSNGHAAPIAHLAVPTAYFAGDSHVHHSGGGQHFGGHSGAGHSGQ